MHPLKTCGIKILIVRRTYPELVNNHINTLRAELLGIAKYNDKDKVLKFNNGASINFMYCNNDKDLDHLQGQEYDIIFLDEATLLSEYQMKSIAACLRGANNFPKRIYYTCNPNGQGMGYIKRIFIEKKYEKGEDPNEYTFIQSLVTDNKILMQSQPDYIKQLEALPTKIRKAWLEGDWNTYEGQVFEEFKDDEEHYLDRRWTHVIEPFEIPSHWIITRSFDWGYSRPYSCGWTAMSEEGIAYRILESYGCTGEANVGVKWTPHEVFAEIQRIESEHRWLKGKKIIGVADPAIWDAETGESIADVAAKYGVYFNKADNKRLAGLMQVHYRFAFDENGIPNFYVFKNCKNFIRTIPLLQYDEHKVEDIDTAQEDHIYDDHRYFCMSRPISPPVIKEKQPFDPIKTFFDIEESEIKANPREKLTIKIEEI